METIRNEEFTAARANWSGPGSVKSLLYIGVVTVQLGKDKSGAARFRRGSQSSRRTYMYFSSSGRNEGAIKF